jgi:hypothetical protein
LEPFQQGTELDKHQIEPALPVIELGLGKLFILCSSAASFELLGEESLHPHEDRMGVPSWIVYSMDGHHVNVNACVVLYPTSEQFFSVYNLTVDGLGAARHASNPIDSTRG